MHILLDEKMGTCLWKVNDTRKASSFSAGRPNEHWWVRRYAQSLKLDVLYASASEDNLDALKSSDLRI